MRPYLAALLIAVFAFTRPTFAELAAKPIRVLLVTGGCCHDFAKQKDILAKGLAERANVEVTISYYDIKENKGGPSKEPSKDPFKP